MSAVEERYSVSFVALGLAVLAVVGSLIHSVIYNIYRHPLASVPGPKLAGATYLYQTYFGLAGGSRYYYQIGRLHEQYGKLKRSSKKGKGFRGVCLSFIRTRCAHHPG